MDNLVSLIFENAKSEKLLDKIALETYEEKLTYENFFSIIFSTNLF